MKILYVTNYMRIAERSGGYFNDYLNDLLYYGFYELFGNDCIDSTQIPTLYSSNKDKILTRNVWGGGMTASWLIDKDEVDRTDIENKIKDKYFDLIIYGACKRCMDYYDLCSMIYPNNKIILLDGNDDTILHSLSNKHPYFKRELLPKEKNGYPISFCIPQCKLTNNINKNKIQEYATVIPGDVETYIFKTESDYYADYNKSYYGATKKKAGWDCMRHYEILGNYCMPYFVDLESCPDTCLTHLPKQKIIEGMKLVEDFNDDKYYGLMDELFEYTKNYLTTKSMASYVLETVLSTTPTLKG